MRLIELDNEVLSVMTLDGLRQLAVNEGLSIGDDVSRDSLFINLVNRRVELTREEEMRPQLSDKYAENVLGSLWKMFEEGCESGNDEIDWTFLVTAIERFVNWSNTPAGRETKRTLIRNQFRRANEGYKGTSKGAVLKHQYNRLLSCWSPVVMVDVAKKNRTTNYHVSIRARDQTVVCIDDALIWADEVLGSVDEVNYPKLWKQVVISLGLVTGRRVYAEIMGDSELVPIDSNTCEFSGQAKLKGRESSAYNIPVLMDAEKVVRAWNLIKGQTSVLREGMAALGQSREQINAKITSNYSRMLGEYYKEWAARYILVEPGKAVKHSPKNLRAMYASYAYGVWGDGYSINAYLADVLGHGALDLNTANSYSCDWKVLSKVEFEKR